jgi:hypothetical protein
MKSALKALSAPSTTPIFIGFSRPVLTKPKIAMNVIGKNSVKKID